MRVGIGYDVHVLEAGRPLVLGGVRVPYDRGLVGHSDADVLTHALVDALLGAAALGTIGEHFPDTDSRFRGISSLELLAESARSGLERQARVVRREQPPPRSLRQQKTTTEKDESAEIKAELRTRG